MELLNLAIALAKKAGELSICERKKVLKVSEKAKNDFVSNVDKASEALIVKAIKKQYPTHGILAEESANSQKETLDIFTNSKYIWIIDPIDGTTNYIHGLPNYAISIGIFETKSAKSSKNFNYLEGEIIAGVVHAPMLNETFTAVKGKGAFLNGKKIEVSKVKTVGSSLTVTGFPPTHRDINIPYFLTMVHNSQAVRRLGSASLDLCYVACGRFDIYWEFGLKPWDIAAGALIVEEAGGKVSDTNGKLPDLFGADVLATNGKVHKETVETFSLVRR